MIRPVEGGNAERKYSFSGKRVWITGHKGMLGSALVRSFEAEEAELLLCSRQELDLTSQRDVNDWVQAHKPELIFHAGAKVGGIYANATAPADFLYANLMIECNVIHAAYQNGVGKLVFVASNCTYPTAAQQPISEDSLLTGELDSNIRSYAVSKIAGIELCMAYRKQYGCEFISVIPPNLYGPGDNYHPEHSHVVAGIMRRAHEAKINGAQELVVWGDGTPRREILHVDDLAAAMKYAMCTPTSEDLFNIGYGKDFSISELANQIAEIVGFDGEIKYDTSKPNGTMGKLLDSSRIRSTGWRPVIDEKEGLKSAYADFIKRWNDPALAGRF
ncbi:GDP-L-fucose synthase family protein [Paracidovorax avenae]|uniref:GDP-L-fucose synthase family protein n=1 Tax=Paracidovorax avenae TaxID=80867 RepID=UPI0009E9B4C3|nr:GDP-L-fucose synthase [Paracidovorax avenae]